MGRKDIVTKEYIRRPEIFADIFNYRLYDGKDRIQPEQLAEENITENLVLEREENGKSQKIFCICSTGEFSGVRHNPRYCIHVWQGGLYACGAGLPGCLCGLH